MARSSFLIAAAIILTGCVTETAADGPFYRSGFNDGCRAAEDQRASFSKEPYQNYGLFQTEPSYRAGWRSGYAQCRPITSNQARPGDFGEQDPL